MIGRDGAAFRWQAKRLGLPTQAAPGAVERPSDETIAAEGTLIWRHD